MRVHLYSYPVCVCVCVLCFYRSSLLCTQIRLLSAFIHFDVFVCACCFCCYFYFVRRLKCAMFQAFEKWANVEWLDVVVVFFVWQLNTPIIIAFIYKLIRWYAVWHCILESVHIKCILFGPGTYHFHFSSLQRPLHSIFTNSFFFSFSSCSDQFWLNFRWIAGIAHSNRCKLGHIRC